MFFKKKKIKKRSFKRNYSKRKYSKKKKKTGIYLFKFMFFLIVSFVLVTLIASIILYKKYIEPLPPVESLRNMEIAEASTIYDSDGNELYKIFKENRTYVEYDDISNNMINAIVAGEDKRFWENPGFDLFGLTRAVIYRVIGKSDKLEGTSTLSQQLMKVVYLSGERKVERKVKEIYLSYKLNKVFSKEKILELYLNKIEYGSNAFGIEAAAKTFFGKSAKELGILESSILASLPKGPSYYSPYNRPDRLLGYPYIYEEGKNEELHKIISSSDVDTYKAEVGLLTTFIKDLKFRDYNGKILVCGINKDQIKSNIRVDNDNCTLLEYSDLLSFLNAIKIRDGKNIIEYQTGRKDFILGRMLEDGYINPEQYRESILNSIGFTFKKYRENIKYAYFVIYVKEYLENKYGKEIVEKGGLKIYTTIKSDYQDKAEELIEKYGKDNETKFGAKNSALISIDNKTGNIISMVGGRDYFDTENGGNNNMITSRLQPGSTFKPFVYAMAMDSNTIGTKTPIYDLETEFPNYTPSNFDGKFQGKMNISTALNSSRNVTAVKMFYLAGGEKKIVQFMDKLGAYTIGDFKNEYFKKYGRDYSYGASMSLGTGLMTPLELAGAYSVFANMGERKEITPIVKIVDSKGNVIEEIEESTVSKNKKAITGELAYITNSILSDTSSRPEFWNKYLSLKDRVVAAKTGTSTKQYTKGGEKIIYPRNLWTAGYTPQVTTVVWSGNTDGEELNFKGNGLEGAGPIWRDYMEYVHKDKPKETWKKPSAVREVSISEVSGLLPSPEGFPSEFIEKSLFINVPESYDKSLGMIEVDALCDGKVTDDTPKSAIKTGYLLNFHSLYPSNPKWEDPVKTWVANGEYKEEYGNFSNIITDYNDQVCERTKQSNMIVSSNVEDNDILFVGDNYIDIAYKSNVAVNKIQVILGDTVIKEIKTFNKTQYGKRVTVNVPSKFANTASKLIVRIVDNQYYSKDYVSKVKVGSKDKLGPVIDLNIPDEVEIKVGESLTVEGKIIDTSDIKSINLYLNEEALKIGLKGRDFKYKIDTSSFYSGEYKFKVESYDALFNKGSKEVILNVSE